MACESLSTSVVRSIAKELHALQESPCEGIRVTINEHNIADVQAEIEGPTGTPYEGGVFRMKLCIGAEFPVVAPKGLFLTKIWHPNVSKEGEICVNVLKRDWKPDLGLRHVLLVIRCLLIEPFPESALNEEAGRALMEDYDEFARHARLMTQLHAMPAKRPMPLTASGANAGTSGGGEASGSAAPPSAEGSPVVKKAKAAALSKAKKSLRRL
jgi:ubiquitin-conjugating enzyme E2 S